jgi:hypothetical protein
LNKRQWQQDRSGSILQQLVQEIYSQKFCGSSKPPWSMAREDKEEVSPEFSQANRLQHEALRLLKHAEESNTMGGL